jgi:hypothetical protein
MVTTIDPVSRVNADIEAKNLGTLGYLLWWSLNDVEVLQSDAESLCVTVGLDPKMCPKIEARGGVVKALESLGFRASPQSGKKMDLDGKARVFYDRTADDEKGFTVTLQERTVANGVAAYVEVQRIHYDRSTKAIDLSTSFMHGDIHAAFKKYCETYRANEVRRIIQNVLAEGKAITVRESGGVYFVPDFYTPTLDKLKAMVAAINGVSLTTLGIVDTEQSRSEMADAAQAEVKRTVDSLMADIQALEARIAEGQNVRESTLEARIDEFKALREKALCYQELVQMEVSDVETALASLTARVEKMLTGE